ncbi:hypothetical protein IFM89_025529, partial [Coptis chinensis]
DAHKYAIKPFSCVIRGLCRIKDIEEAKKAGDLDEAMGLLKVMESRGLRPDVYTYSVLMSGYVKGGQMDEEHSLLSEAKTKHAKLCPVMFDILTRGYCKLEEFDKAVELLNEMKDYGVYPNADEYNKMKAAELLNEMKDYGVYPNADEYNKMIQSVYFGFLLMGIGAVSGAELVIKVVKNLRVCVDCHAAIKGAVPINDAIMQPLCCEG